MTARSRKRSVKAVLRVRRGILKHFFGPRHRDDLSRAQQPQCHSPVDTFPWRLTSLYRLSPTLREGKTPWRREYRVDESNSTVDDSGGSSAVDRTPRSSRSVGEGGLISLLQGHIG